MFVQAGAGSAKFHSQPGKNITSSNNEIGFLARLQCPGQIFLMSGIGRVDCKTGECLDCSPLFFEKPAAAAVAGRDCAKIQYSSFQHHPVIPAPPCHSSTTLSFQHHPVIPAPPRHSSTTPSFQHHPVIPAKAGIQ